MANSYPINRIILTGEVVEDPIVHYLAPAYPEVRLRLRTQQELPIYGGTQSQLRQLFHSLVARGHVGIQIERSVRLGTLLSVIGRIDYHRETDRQGQTKAVTEIIVEQIQLHRSFVQEDKSHTPEKSDETPLFDPKRYTPAEEEDPLS